VKWDYELRLGAQLETVVDRALAIARSEPAGPVYLTLPREVLAERLDEFEYSAPPRLVDGGAAVAAPAAVAQAARILAAARNPIRGFAADVALPGLPRLTLSALADAVRAAADAPSVAARRLRWEAEHRRLREAWAARARAVRQARPIDMAWLSRCIGDLADERTLVVNEYDLDPTQICRRAPGSYFGSSPASGLGWGLGGAVGAKLAAPEKTVICCVGDGAYYFGAPASTHWVARAQGLPVLFVVFNNGAWNAVKQSVRHHAPDGWAVRTEAMPLTA